MIAETHSVDIGVAIYKFIPHHRKRGSAAKYKDEVNDHPVLTYVYHILPWFFEAFMSSSSDEFLPGKKVAMEMLCKSLIRWVTNGPAIKNFLLPFV